MPDSQATAGPTAPDQASDHAQPVPVSSHPHSDPADDQPQRQMGPIAGRAEPGRASAASDPPAPPTPPDATAPLTPGTSSAALAHAPLGARAWVGIVSHGVVDFFSYIIVPLMPLLVTRLDLSDTHKALVLAVGSVCSGLVQPLVAWVSDALNTRLLGTLGLVMAAVATTLVGYAQSLTALLIVQAVSSLGIGAFHPVAAAAVGQLAGRRRSVAVSWFFVGGMLGGMTGNVLSPVYADSFGLLALPALMVPGLITAAALAWAIHGVSHHQHHAGAGRAPRRHDQPQTGQRTGPGAPAAQPDPAERAARWRVVWVLYAGNVARFLVNNALVYLFIDWALEHTAARRGLALSQLDDAARRSLGLAASGLNGWAQASMQVGMGGPALLLGWWLTHRRERAALLLIPVVGAAAVASAPALQGLAAGQGMGWLTVPGMLLVAVGAGLGFGAVMPATISLAQRLLPHRTGLASGLMMGGAWGLGSTGPLLARSLQHTLGNTPAWLIVAGVLLLSGCLAWLIPPAVLQRVSGR